MASQTEILMPELLFLLLNIDVQGTDDVRTRRWTLQSSSSSWPAHQQVIICPLCIRTIRASNSQQMSDISIVWLNACSFGNLSYLKIEQYCCSLWAVR